MITYPSGRTGMYEFKAVGLSGDPQELGSVLTWFTGVVVRGFGSKSRGG